MVAILNEFPLRAKKARDYAIWRTAVHEWCRLAGNHRADYTVMQALKDELATTRAYGETAIATAAVTDRQLELGATG